MTQKLKMLFCDDTNYFSNIYNTNYFCDDTKFSIFLI